MCHIPPHHSPRNHTETYHTPTHHSPTNPHSTALGTITLDPIAPNIKHHNSQGGGGIANQTCTSPIISFGALWNLETRHNGHTHLHTHTHTHTYNLFLLAQCSTKPFLQKPLVHARLRNLDPA